jgi:cob(I)alamin adenosyltransferase
MTIYTKTGDRGKTTLFSGERVTKDHDRIQACGDMDELNAAIGVLIASLDPAGGQTGAQLMRIQSDLLHAEPGWRQPPARRPGSAWRPSRKRPAAPWSLSSMPWRPNCPN